MKKRTCPTCGKTQVCVGWGIWVLPFERIWSNHNGVSCFKTERHAIDAYNQTAGALKYEDDILENFAIAKQLWVDE